MPSQRTELRDELKAIIAAGRDLTPEHDEALAEVFLDRVEERTKARVRSPRRPMAVQRTRRVIAAVCLAGACVGGGAIAVSYTTTVPNNASQSAQPKAPVGPQFKGPAGPKKPNMPVVVKVAPQLKTP
jgi:hypothetical protein